MALPDTNIEDQLIDPDAVREITQEKTVETVIEKVVVPAPQTPMEHASEQIGRTVRDIAAGRSEGRHPALDKIINSDPDRYERDTHADCGPMCQQKRIMAQSRINRVSIADVRPPVKERLAIVEHEIDDLNSILGSHEEMILMAASRDSVKDLEHNTKEAVREKVDHVYLWHKDNIEPRISKLERKRFIRDWALTISLTVSLIYSVILTYDKFIR